MKIKIKQCDNYWFYDNMYGKFYKKSFDYMFKHLDFDKLNKHSYIIFNSQNAEEWFCETYINRCHLKEIYNNSPDGYQWLKNNWGNGRFRISVFYEDKQELKTIINRFINIELIRKDTNSEN